MILWLDFHWLARGRKLSSFNHWWGKYFDIQLSWIASYWPKIPLPNKVAFSSLSSLQHYTFDWSLQKVTKNCKKITNTPTSWYFSTESPNIQSSVRKGLNPDSRGQLTAMMASFTVRDEGIPLLLTAPPWRGHRIWLLSEKESIREKQGTSHLQMHGCFNNNPISEVTSETGEVR